ncbi:MAG TPA: biotin-dependent carboxyltransferase family protein [Bacteroidota bacterium]|nr:biotin-dependent carboxyltransferase family protein [Bacteroidota bacterium]
MPRILVHTPGFLTTIQDLGRPGFAHLGVSASGAADALSLRLGNLLVGNPETAAGLEMTLIGGVFEFESETLVAVTGSDFEPRLNGASVPLWTSFAVRGGDRLEFGPTKSGARCYLCIRGGVDCPPVLGSASTHLLTSLGGLEGRALKKGDVIQIHRGSPQHSALLRMKPEVLDALFQATPLRVTRGPQADWFSRETHALLSSSPYTVSENSNRMGLRLIGPELKRTIDRELLTEGVSLGAVQVPQGGQPIILFVEHQTTGGYPKIANVILADMHRVGQLRPRDEVRFEFISMDMALNLFQQQELLVNPQSLVPA